MTIEILAIGTLAIILYLAISVYRDFRRDKAEEELAEFEASAKGMEKVLMPISSEFSGKATYFYYAKPDELGMQAAAYAEYEAPENALERRADSEEIPDEKLSAFLGWANEESEDGE